MKRRCPDCRCGAPAPDIEDVVGGILSRLKETSEGICSGTEGPQRALVAVSRVTNAAVVLSGSCGLRFDMEENGLDAGDVWTPSELEDAFLRPGTRNGGIRVWEGRLVSSPGNWEHPEVVDVEYRGAWRDPSAAEAAEVVAGRDPFRCPYCDGAGNLPILVRAPAEGDIP